MNRWMVGLVISVALIESAVLSVLLVDSKEPLGGYPDEDQRHAQQYIAEVSHGPSIPNYIVIESLDLTFTEEAYHERVRDQIELEGWEAICVGHLGTLAREAQYLSVNSARQNLVYVTECAASELAQEAPVP